MEPHPNAASMLRTRSIPSLPSHHPPPLLALSTRMLSPSPSPSSSSTTTSSEARLPYSSLNPKSSFHPFPLFSNPNTHTLQSMTLSKCFSHSGPTNPIPISEIPESDATTHSLVVVSFYKFADFPDHALMRDPLKQLCQQLVLLIIPFLSLFTFSQIGKIPKLLWVHSTLLLLLFMKL